ncbi:hypothetical protein GIB67_039156 [Kingdonia uniflora]|uniref:Uncharacterized protein n=1 Tax=Kingdonia uniflora TaxID=39325 RepID=A0A7J7MLM4_9MAGN|nr:hypothetical protein GIB67_039156 [Kingdonia uniflora]
MSLVSREIICDYPLIQKNGILNKEQCIRLYEEMNKYRSLPKISRDDFGHIFTQLDSSRDMKVIVLKLWINLEEFSELCNAIAVKFEKEASPSWLEYYPSLYHSRSATKLKAFVKSPTFGYIVVFILMLNLVAVIIETTV